MELRQLRYFVKTAEILNFTEAASMLYISQSTLSQQVKQLEEELNTPLFDRIGKKVMLTEAGRLFLPYARQSIQHAEDGQHLLEDLQDLETGELAIGVTYGLQALVTRTLIAFSARYPQIKIVMASGTSLDLLEKLRQVQLDFVLSFTPAQKNDVLISQTLFESRLSLIVPINDPLAARRSVDIKEVESLPLLMPSKGFNTRSFLDKVFEKNKIYPDIKMELSDISILLQLVATGRWYTVLTTASLVGQTAVQAVMITGKEMSRQATISWPANAYRKKAAIAFAEMLQQSGGE
ncbi:LysR substrate-binding domain-containing protein [Chitinophaga sp.]|uniref:LysR substrate-binding domain-containing protein n=1 Tax=Chitinophaga sp. TaxID=1869181 RepID=UPI0031D4C0A7